MALRAHEMALARQHDCNSDGDGEREQRVGGESGPPIEQVGDEAGNEPAAKAAAARSRRIEPGDPGHLARRPFVADIGDGDREDRRQQHPLNEAQDHELRHA